MPRGKDHRRARARNFAPMDLGPTGHPSPSAPSSRSGTGFRHPVRRWPMSAATGKSHKCLVPPESPGEKFVLVVGDSHLRALVDGIVRMPGGGGMTFGFMSTPGASAAELYKEVRHANIPRTPDLVCLLAPSNNLTASRTLPEAAVDFRRLLTLLQSKWSKLFVLDFPPRLTVAPDLQTFLRQDFNRVAAQMGIKYLSVAEHFSLDHLALWARDGVHLSDDGGMVLLASLLWNYSALQLVEPEVQAPPPASPRPAVRRVTPKVVVREHPVSPPPTNPFEWACKVGKAKAAPLPVSPVRFSPAILDLMDKFYPSDLDCAGAAAPVPAGNKTSRARRRRRAVAASQRAAPRPQAEVPEHVEVKPRPSPARRARKERVPAQDRVGVTPRSPTKDVTVEQPVDQDQQQRGRRAAGGKKSSKGKSCSPSCICCAVQPCSDPIILFGPSEGNSEVVAAPASCSVEAVSDSSSVDMEVGVTFGSSDDELVTSEVQEPGPVPAAGMLKFPSIRGSFHQGSELFGSNSGRQCMAISLLAAAKHTVKGVFQWDGCELDSVLLAGDQVYSDLQRQNKITDSAGFLRATDLPDQVVVDGVELSCVFGEVVSGDAKINSGEFVDAGVLVPLREGLARMMAQYNTCLLTLCENTCAVIAENGRWAIVDSHSRSPEGMRVPDGSSVVLFFDSVGEVHDYLQRSVEGIVLTEFEMVGVVVFSASNTFSPFLGSPAESNSLNLCKESLFHDTSLDVTVEPKKTATKRKMDSKIDIAGPSVENLKKVKLEDVALKDQDVIFSEPEQEIFYFNPLNLDVCQALCSMLNIEFQNFNAPPAPPIGLLGPPCTNERIIGDGNCYFRAISQAVSGSQNSHRKIRLAVVKQLETNPHLYSWVIGREYSSVAEYITKSRMRFVSVWATDVEIQATADLLGVNVFVLFGGRWLRHQSSGPQLSENAIYIENCGGTHFETVVCVKDPQQDRCAGCCPSANKQPKTYYMRSDEKDNICSTDMRTTSVIDNKSKCIKFTSKYLLCQKRQQTAKKLKGKIYTENERERLKRVIREKYFKNKSYRQKVMVTNKRHHKLRYMENDDFREMVKSKAKMQYADKMDKIKSKRKAKYIQDSAHRSTLITLSKERYRKDAKHRNTLIALSKEKYRKDAKHRNTLIALSKEKYRKDAKHRNTLIALSKEKYRKDAKHRNTLIALSKETYRKDAKHRNTLIALSKEKYRKDAKHRNTLIALSKEKYRKDAKHRNTLIALSKEKYRKDAKHRNTLIALSKEKYRNDKSHKLGLKALNKKRYRENPAFRKSVISKVKVKRQLSKKRAEHFQEVMQDFLKKVEKGPEFVCCVCNRLLFHHQVLLCVRETYSKSAKMAEIADACISEDYLHRCNMDCESPCLFLGTARSALWICHCCDSKLKRGLTPPEWVGNNLEVCPVPPELACLNGLEQHLIALHIPFMKMLALPKGGQNGVHGPITCVPANLVQTTNVLPRSDMEGSLLRVKLKRKLTYKGHYEYQFVDTMHIRRALQYLKRNNKYYKDIEFNEAWLNDFCKEELEEENRNEPEKQTDKKDEKEDEADDGEDELLHDRQNHCMFQDSALFPVDIGQEVLDQYFEDILNLAPAEGNNPVRLLTNRENEAKCFPVIFPDGKNVYHENRRFKLTLSRYFNNRILHADGRFAQNVEYIFFAQYMSEVEKVVSSVSVALRKEKSGSASEGVSADARSEKTLKKLLEADQGFCFLRPIRGTPAFWQATQKDLLACVRQLGIPTWFCSFSAADMRWKNLLDTVLRQEGRTQTADQLDWAERCELLRRNSVTAARMFDFRWHCFLRVVLMSPANPIGKIVDFFYRIEFQQRGSPHVHVLFWIEGAPRIGKESEEEVAAFIDKYVTCEIPQDDEVLREIVLAVQQHSRNHTKSCKKGGTKCRFNFPKTASGRTFVIEDEKIVKCPKCTDPNVKAGEVSKLECICWKIDMKKQIAAEAFDFLTEINRVVNDDKSEFETLEQIFEYFQIDQEIYEKLFRACHRRSQVVLKRNKNEIWINPYNKSLLKCWNANMDIQYIVDAFACVVYIISYISKEEREIGLLLRNTQKEAEKGNTSAKETLKKLGTVYLHNRHVSAQEAVYRLANMHLKECSRKVVFIPTGDNIIRMSKPLAVLQQQDESGSQWMLNIVDRYKNRPHDQEFDDLCIATFASEYRLLSKNESSKNAIELQNNCGVVVKRTRTKPAVVRYARFSEHKNPERFHLSILQLFLPYRTDDDLKPQDFKFYQDYYKNGTVRLRSGEHTVESVVDRNREKFEREADALELAQAELSDAEFLEAAWDILVPGAQLEQRESEMEQREQLVERGTEGEHQEDIPDLDVLRGEAARLEKSPGLSREEGLLLISSLNELQLSTFLHVREWCLQKVSGQNPDPLHMFVTGGAGTGKSHLIRAIQYEATRLLSPLCLQPDAMSVLLTAPTGIAAYSLKAATIHTTFGIGTEFRLPYSPLGEEKLNSMRVKYHDLQILIIDEISMVDHRLLIYIHGRLRQIKQTGDFSPFGKVSIIAVGDFYQLPPVKGKPLYAEKSELNLWSMCFKVVELTEIVRQKDQAFAQMLNRLRTRTKDTKLLPSDVQMLKQCETGEDSTALHIFPTNAQVFQHNLEQLKITCENYCEIVAEDFIPSKETGKLQLMSGHHKKVKNSCLEERLLLGVNARVMLCKNLDITDGLVNGACGIVTHIESYTEGGFPKYVYVKFDDEEIGKIARRTCAKADLPGSTAIEPEEERVSQKGGMRRQFPLKLAWACTVHKVQGLTVDKAVVSFNKIFAAGQVYVAVSRVRTIEGLIIRDFKEKAIYCNKHAKAALQKMPPLLSDERRCDPSSFRVFLLNVQGLCRHVSYLAHCTQQLQPNCIAVTETWLTPSSALEAVQMDGFSFHSRPRGLSYSGTNPALVGLKSQQHGGVGIYCTDGGDYQILDKPDLNLECVVYRSLALNLVLAVVYRPPSYPVVLFRSHLQDLVLWLETQSESVVVMGDFNEDLLKSSSIFNLMTDRGFRQHVTSPTTERGETIIDHVYAKTSKFTVKAVVSQIYFSDHEGILCSFSAS
ncbi:uncharacterized protein LOC144988280 isoform X2 [Oryzias latipes]